MSKLIVELPEEMHEGLKQMAVLQHRTIKEVVTDLVEEYLATSEHKEQVSETGLCGRWRDERTADDIIADIESHRHWFKKGRAKSA